ncbi:hypothetical protein NEOLEDRAFT_1246397 [Neolentinus lepideus HHB14362 ss-1]|uniref:BTB domain-containing protein n=1 Tax=Neolentinus lepideus HHB14362 ss-1 TaxID=1314782 RepID=A0A165MMY5_9AGAM|nr:hypothetical protein NEOLEDRAFT_1246397 [Neolentinus lepideus HHB14362 ss-1]
MDEYPRKRQRKPEQKFREPTPSLPPVSKLKKHELLYLADGNIILVSPIFADMFALPPSDLNEMYDGVSIVRMPDKGEDLEQLLMVLYHQTTLPLKRLDPNVPALVKPVLLLTIKYEIDHLKNQIVAHFRDSWSTSLREWDTLEAEMAGTTKQWHLDHNCSFNTCNDYSDDHLPEPASAIQLAKECGLPEILPAAFYHLSRLSVKWGPHGCETNKQSQTLGLHEGLRTARWKMLTAEDYYKLLIGRTNMQSAVIKRIESWRQNFHVEEPTDDTDEEEMAACSGSDKHAFLMSLKKVLRESNDMLFDLQHHVDNYGLLPQKQMCTRCYLSLTNEFIPLRKYIWDHIPEWFDLEPASNYVVYGAHHVVLESPPHCSPSIILLRVINLPPISFIHEVGPRRL